MYMADENPFLKHIFRGAYITETIAIELQKQHCTFFQVKIEEKTSVN